MKGLALFGWASLGAICLLLFLFILFYLTFTRGQTWNLLELPDKVQALTSLLALLFGTAAALGGAIATIQVASLGLELSKQQEARDSLQFIDSKATEALNLYSDLLLSISNTFASGVVLDLKTSDLDQSNIMERMSDPLSQEFEPETLAFASRLRELTVAIEAVLKNEFAHFCFQKSASGYSGKLDHISKSLQDLGVPESEARVSLENLNDVNALIDIATRRMTNGTLGDVVQAKLFVNSSETDLFKLSYNNRNVRSFLFVGNLIFARAEMEGEMFIASYGSAILHDLTRATPDGEFVSQCLSERYPQISEPLDAQKVYFDPANVASRNLQAALEDIDAIGDLYVLLGKPPGTPQRPSDGQRPPDGQPLPPDGQ